MTDVGVLCQGEWRQDLMDTVEDICLSPREGLMFGAEGCRVGMVTHSFPCSFPWHCRLTAVLSPCPPGSQGRQWVLCLPGWHLSALSKSQGHHACWILDLEHTVSSCSLLPEGHYFHQLSSHPWGGWVPAPSAGAVRHGGCWASHPVPASLSEPRVEGNVVL